MQNIPWYLLLGVITGLVSVYFTRLTLFIEARYKKIRNMYIRILSGGLVVGILVFLFPAFYGEGYDAIMLLLKGESVSLFQNSLFSRLGSGYLVFILFFLCLILLKVVASSSTTGAGGVGGIFAPTLFLGGMTGFLTASILNEFALIDLPDNRFVLVGMAGTMSAVMHAPLTAIFLIAEITGGYSLLIPLIITSTIAYITIKGFERHSIYHIQLAERGELITHDKNQAVLTMMDWKKEIERDLITVHASDNLGEMVKTISKSTRNIFPVVDEYNIFQGVVHLDDVREIMFNSDLYDTVKVRELMTIPPVYLDLEEKVETVMDAFTKSDVWNLPVLDKGYYVGFVSKSRIFGTYRDLLVQFSGE